MKKFGAIFLAAALGAAMGIGSMNLFAPKNNLPFADRAAFHLASHDDGHVALSYPDFVQASSLALPSVVHVKSTVELSNSRSQSFNPWFPDLFGQQAPMRQSAGSGVIFSGDGYIITNNHVIREADKIEVVLNDKRSYPAKVIGTDPTTDLALLKIDESGLPYLSLGNSDQINVGEWVLAVGNPFNLTSTVTAGIVSAKGRSLNILEGAFKIESFIQTDAAVNPGNSGGALINSKGEVIGINTAIASETGSYAGYSFAIPSNLVKKVMEDLKTHGKVQRGIIGVNISDIDAELAEKAGLDVLQGVYVAGTIDGSAAEEAGIEEGDVITAINETPVNSSSELQGLVGTYRPGDKIQVTLHRKGNVKNLDVVLKAIDGSSRIADTETRPPSGKTSAGLGASMCPLTVNEKNKLGIGNGVKITEVKPGILSDLGVEEGFIITHINNKAVDDAAAVEELYDKSGNMVQIKGINPD